MKTAPEKRILLMLFPLLLLSLLSGWSIGAVGEDDSVYLAFSSDVHNGQAGNSSIKPWLSWLQTKVAKLDAIGFCGDMGNNNINDAESYWQSVQSVLDLTDGLQTSGFIINKPVFIFGNHEWRDGKLPAYENYKTVLRFHNQGEAVRTPKYVIYSFGASMATPPTKYDEQEIAKLQSYLDTAPNDIPIIILTHYPLYDYSTIKTENSDKVIQVLNRKPNIICFWGHYHAVAGNFDNILTAGSKLPVGNKDITINFTYLQAGCLNTNGTNKRGTIMKLNGRDITLTRYDAAGAVIDSRTIGKSPANQ